MHNKRTILKIVLIAIGALVSIGYYIVVYHVLPYSPIRPQRVDCNENQFLTAINPNVVHSLLKPFDVVVEDSITLKGWFITARTDSVLGTIILLHGIASCKESLLGLADTLTQIGFNCILYDSRAHGKSGGTNCTFGFYEKQDVSHYIDESLKRFGNITPFAVYGNSLGAAVALQAMARDKRIKCGIVESPFAALREIVYDYWKRMSGLPVHFVPNAALKRSEIIAGFAVDSVKPEESAKWIDQPVLIAHGNEDEHISIDYGKRVYDNLRSSNKQWHPIIGGNHYNLSSAGGQHYRKTMINYFRTYLKN